jgi:AcrR family transcriptional regulator
MPDPLSPRKLPVQGRSKATRSAILEAATQILARGGLPAYTTNAVAQRAGVSIGSFYQYFPNKDALMMALIAEHQSERARRVADGVAQALELPLEQGLRLLVKAAMADDVNEGMLAAALDHEEARLPSAAMVSAELDQLTWPLAEALRRRYPEATEDWLLTKAETLPSIVRAVVDHWTSQKPPQLETAENEAVRAVLGYLQQGQP